MKNPPSLKMAILAFSLFCIFAGVSSAQVLNHNEVEFTGTVAHVYPGSEGAGTIDVAVNETTVLKVLVGADTDIASGESEITINDLADGDFVKVEGKFSSEGVLASSIEKLTSDTENGFEVRGQITAIEVKDTSVLISIAGIIVTADASMTTSGRPGTRVNVASLTPGTAVSIEGTISGDTWTATSIHVFSEKGKRKNVVRFEGTIQSIDGSMINVLIDGNDIPQPVIVSPDTRTCGTLVVGAVVEVKGKLNAELQVEADVICVIGALEIKPDRLKLKVGTTEWLIVKLRETASSDVTVELAVNSDIVTLSGVSVTIPQGSKIATFSVTAGQVAGEAQITATANGQTATADVFVGQFSDSDNENPNAAVRVVFAPDHIKLGAGETRDVDLLVHPPEVQLSPENVLFQVTGDVESAVIKRDLGNGTARYKVTVTAKAAPAGTSGSVTATPSGIDGAGTAELVVVITNKGK
jgi:hypothetical protein